MLWAGVLCAVVGNVVNSLGFLLKRHVHTSNSEGVSVLRLPVWWVALTCLVVGELGNLAAYGMAPAAVVSPLGAVTVVSNAVLSRVYLKEHISSRGVSGVVLALMGSVLVVMDTPVSLDDTCIYDCIVSWSGLVLVLVVVVGCFTLANPFNYHYLLPRELAKRHVVFYCMICSLLGVITVASAKGIATAIEQTVGGDAGMFLNADTSWLTYVLIVSVIASNLLQLYFLNVVLAHFEASVVVPVYYIFFTSVSIATGMILFHETVFEPFARSVLLFVLGVLMAFAGVYLVDKQSDSASQHQTPLISTDPVLNASFRSLEVRQYMFRRNAFGLNINGALVAPV